MTRVAGAYRAILCRCFHALSATMSDRAAHAARASRPQLEHLDEPVQRNDERLGGRHAAR
jgi:hypothetical protein